VKEEISRDGLRGENSSADTQGTGTANIYKMRGNACRGIKNLKGLKLTRETVISDDVRNINNLFISFKM
jgi:hypothetical protein